MVRFPIFTAILTQFPVYLAWIVGMVLALIYWKKHPSVSLAALFGFACLTLLSLIGQFISPYHGLNWGQAGFAFLEALIRAGAWCLVLVAVFGWRK